jgi:hypothetical protein
MPNAMYTGQAKFYIVKGFVIESQVAARCQWRSGEKSTWRCQCRLLLWNRTRLNKCIDQALSAELQVAYFSEAESLTGIRKTNGRLNGKTHFSESSEKGFRLRLGGRIIDLRIRLDVGQMASSSLPGRGT